MITTGLRSRVKIIFREMHKIFPTLFPMRYNVLVGNKSWEKDGDL